MNNKLYSYLSWIQSLAREVAVISMISSLVAHSLSLLKIESLGEG